ncbi:tRNA (adenine-N(1))-methyltransferase [Bacillus sp. FJAT-42376]|uniref:tRNA (adenine(22)-N(1))-methyltransferase n=1 Tax=Bacillus sp. FJAT-42376 TaxID=2014076 RepID=UPI000F516E50|nr:tRNA (adenine(22)-N(1))-methyltransferase TrmK [Bacillus sp. FJAT-42376]AZB43653.1 tRNA (adenine-N(1))-methyltransferase [Bacillus sp. FJAT-42376]
MNEMKLSKRLSAVADFIPEGAILADIGSDHAYLPSYAVMNGKIQKAIAGEVVEGPYQSAVKQVEKTGLSNQIDVRKGDGLAVLKPSEATCITIAGMGGGLIAKILEDGKNKLERAERLVLQPNVHANHVRTWLIANGWELIAESILEEDQKIYEILVAEKGNPMKPYEHKNEAAAILYGPFLMQEKNEVFLKKWTREKAHWTSVISQIEKGKSTEESIKRRQDMEELIKMAEEVLT